MFQFSISTKISPSRGDVAAIAAVAAKNASHLKSDHFEGDWRPGAMDQKEIGSRIRQRREEKRLKLSELAHKAGIGKSSLSKIESGDSQNPSVHTVVALAAVLGTTVEDLMGIEGEPNTLMISPSLQEFVTRARLPSVDAQMLASISYRGKRPVSRLDWWFLYEAIKRSVRGGIDE